MQLGQTVSGRSRGLGGQGREACRSSRDQVRSPFAGTYGAGLESEVDARNEQGGDLKRAMNVFRMQDGNRTLKKDNYFKDRGTV
jgi:hypothetical protein